MPPALDTARNEKGVSTPRGLLKLTAMSEAGGLLACPTINEDSIELV